MELVQENINGLHTPFHENYTGNKTTCLHNELCNYAEIVPISVLTKFPFAAVLPFKLMSSSQATASVSLEAVLPFTDSTCTNINQHKVSLTKESCRNTGLVTGAPSPPDVELCSEQWQISRASSDVEREAKGLVFRSSTSRISPTSLQMNSPPLETEAMAVDLSAPANVFKCLVRKST